jgi:hypothetical protein
MLLIFVIVLNRTFKVLDTLLHGGESLERQLSSAGTQLFFRPGEEVIREMDFLSCVHVVHRGRVIISKNGKRLAVLTRVLLLSIVDR